MERPQAVALRITIFPLNSINSGTPIFMQAFSHKSGKADVRLFRLFRKNSGLVLLHRARGMGRRGAGRATGRATLRGDAATAGE